MPESLEGRADEGASKNGKVMKLWLDLKYGIPGSGLLLARIEDHDILRYIKNYVLVEQAKAVAEAKRTDIDMAMDQHHEFLRLKKLLDHFLPPEKDEEELYKPYLEEANFFGSVQLGKKGRTDERPAIIIDR